MSRGVVAIVVTVGLALLVMPALAADDKTLQAVDYAFEPDDVTIQVGDTVTFTISPSATNFHNFHFADGPAYPQVPSGPGSAWDGQARTFTAAGRYTFACDAHPTMTGAVNVEPAASTPTPTPTATPMPSDPVEVQTLRMAAGPFCTKRGPRCEKPGVRLRIDLSQPGAVSGTLRKRNQSFGRVRFGTVPAGLRTLTFRRNAAGRRLRAGRYTLRLQVAGEPQDALGFRVR
jgi:plastocyanin